MQEKGFFISVISPQGGAGVSTASVMIGEQLAAREFETILVSPGANYEYYPDINSDKVTNLTEAYFSYTKGRHIIFQKSDDKAKTPLDLILGRFEASRKSDLIIYRPFNNFIEADEIKDSDFMNFIEKSFGSADFCIIDTGRIPPVKLCGVLGLADIVIIILDCRDIYYQYKLEGFLKSLVKVFIDPLFINKCYCVLNYSTEKDTAIVRRITENETNTKGISIYRMPDLSRVKLNFSNIDIKKLRNTGIAEIADEIIKVRDGVYV